MESEVEIKTLENHVFEAIGHASMCWSETPKGVFDTLEATKCGNVLMNHINTDVPHACSVLFKALREDKDFYYAYQANIAMAFKDAYWNYFKLKGNTEYREVYDIHKIANQAAKNFLNLLIKPTE
jgi:acyl-CoA reductase-like NAD-dependent aldehyde dehydrogenase